jgi:hypothetical protein
LSTSYKILSDFLPTRLTSCISEISGDHQYGFRRNKSTANQIFYIFQIVERKEEYNGIVRQIRIDLKNACDSVKREVTCNVLLEFGIPKKLVRLIKMCLNETYSKVRVGKLMSNKFPIQIG